MMAQTISHYRLTEKLGGGGNQAEDTELEGFVALKFGEHRISKPDRNVSILQR